MNGRTKIIYAGESLTKFEALYRSKCLIFGLGLPYERKSNNMGLSAFATLISRTA